MFQLQQYETVLQKGSIVNLSIQSIPGAAFLVKYFALSIVLMITRALTRDSNNFVKIIP